ncbi:MAG: response regulator [Magnetococcales bacterium]|nr:response regulator [Magnetococcales bacterium]
MAKSAPSLLLVEDEPDQAALIREYLDLDAGSPFAVDHVDRLELALERVGGLHPQVVLLDLNLPDSSGLDTLIRFRDLAPEVPVVVMTGISDQDMAVSALRHGAQDYLLKNQVASGDLLSRVLRFAVERHAIQHDLVESRAEFRAIVDNNADAILVIDLQGCVRFANQAVGVLFSGHHLEPGDVFGFPIATNGATELDVVPFGPLRRVAEMRVARIQWHSEEAFLASFRDITSHKRLEEELRRSKKEADLANQAKSTFLAVMSHEIRTPITAIIGISELIEDTPLNEEQRELVGWLKNSSETLLMLINDVLDLSKVEAGELQLETAEFGLNDLAQSVASVARPRTVQKGLSFNLELDPRLPPSLIGDARRIRQILLNLLSNAVKFTERGAITLHIAPAPGDNAAMFYFSVIDTGIGIPQERLDSIFEDYVQADATISRRYGGTGLGLGISRRLAMLMNGEIIVESRPGRGSAFHVRLPLSGVGEHTPFADAEPLLAGERPDSSLAGRRVLLLESNLVDRLALSRSLTEAGLVVEETGEYAEGGTLLRQAAQRGTPFHLILAGSPRPGDDSEGALATLMNDRDYGGQPVLLLREAWGDLLKRYTAEEGSGLQGVGRDELLSHMVSPLERGRSLRILVVDDTMEIRQMIQACFRRSLHKLDLAENGHDALQKFRAGRFDLVLMDMEMPVMGGLEATRAIRAWEREQRAFPTPVLAFSATVAQELRLAALEAGCNGLIPKPIRGKDLLQLVHKYAR